jgi:hypothetical protein
LLIGFILVITLGFFINGVIGFYKKVSFDKNYEIPKLYLPIEYFSEKDISWGYAGENGIGWDSGAIEGYQSFPTTEITLSTKDYSQKIELLPPIKSRREILEDSGIYRSSFEELMKKYGDIATRLLPDVDITNLEKFDVDKDGNSETVLSVCSYGGNHCPHKIMILKNDKIIFSVSAGIVGLDVTKSDTGNGFYVEWTPSLNDGSKWDQGLCCPVGYKKTRFVFEEKEFKPVYEQEILYSMIEDTKK